MLPGSARAQALVEGAEVAWTDLPGCASQAEAATMLVTALGGPLRAAEGTRLEVVFAPGHTVSVTVTLGETTRARTLASSAGCRALDEGLVVVIALLVDEVQAAAPASPPSITVPVLAPAQPASLRGALLGAAVLRVDALPGATFGAHLGGELIADPITIGLSATYFPSSVAGDVSGAWAEVSAVGGTLELCALGAPVPELALGGCAGAAAWAVSATGHGLDVGGTSLGLEVDVLAHGRLDVRIWGPLSLRAEVGLGLAAVRARIYFEQAGGPTTLHVTSIAFPTALLGLQVRFGE